MSERYWLKLSKGNILSVIKLLGLHPTSLIARRVMKEFDYCLRHIKKTDEAHKVVYGERKDKKNKDNSFIN